jgi:retinol dehydrogenase 10
MAGEENITIVLWDINEEGMQSTQRDCEAKGAEVHCYRVDVSKREVVYETAERVRGLSVQ